MSFFIYFSKIFVKQGFTPGDAGGNLYAIQAVTQGQIPFKDFLWGYGPLMLYYNALFFKWLGSSIQSALWAKLFLEVAFTGVFFLAARRIMPLFGAFLATFAYCVFKPEFLHNFNHYAGVCMEIGILWAVLSYCQKPKEGFILWAAGFTFILGLIKINFGVVFLLSTFISFILCDLFWHKCFSMHRIYRYSMNILFVILFWVSIYYAFIRTLSWTQISQCFPFAGEYRYSDLGIFSNFFYFMRVSWLDAIENKNFSMLFTFSAFFSGLWCLGRMVTARSASVFDGRNFPLILIILSIFTVAGIHEFLKATVDYQVFWARPFIVILVSYLICEALLRSSGNIKAGVFVVFFLVLCFQEYRNVWYLERFRNPEHFFESKHMNIYVTEAPKDIKSMLETVRYIKKNIPEDQSFFTFPLNAGYYYLTDRPAPVWFLTLLRFYNHTIEQEREVVRDLERKKINYIVLPSLCYADFGQFGKLGKDYLFELAEYIDENYEEIACFGQWSSGEEKRYVGGMGTKILKRKGGI